MVVARGASFGLIASFATRSISLFFCVDILTYAPIGPSNVLLD